MTSCGSWAPSRLLTISESDEVVVRRKLNVPAWTALVTLYSTHWPAGAAPAVARAEPTGPGALFQVVPVSVQPEPVAKTDPPDLLASVTKSRSLADVTEPIGGTTNRTRLRYVSGCSAVPARSRSVSRVP